MGQIHTGFGNQCGQLGNEIHRLEDDVGGPIPIRHLFDDPAQFDDWVVKWRERAGEEMLTDKVRQASIQSVNPVYIPRNHQIEAAIRAAEDQGDFSVFHALHEVLQRPFTWQEGKDRYMQPPEPDEVVRKTFCGT